MDWKGFLGTNGLAYLAKSVSNQNFFEVLTIIMISKQQKGALHLATREVRLSAAFHRVFLRLPSQHRPRSRKRRSGTNVVKLFTYVVEQFS
jgi:hypothetical protein